MPDSFCRKSTAPDLSPLLSPAIKPASITTSQILRSFVWAAPHSQHDRHKTSTTHSIDASNAPPPPIHSLHPPAKTSMRARIPVANLFLQLHRGVFGHKL